MERTKTLQKNFNDINSQQLIGKKLKFARRRYPANKKSM